MKTIGLGTVGGQWAKAYDKSALIIDHVKVAKGVSWPKQAKPEDYEKNVPKRLPSLLSRIKGPVTFFVSPVNELSFSSLVILEKLKEQEILIVYIKPTALQLKDFRIFQRHSFVGGVLAEYARSGAVEQLFLVDLEQMKEVSDDPTLALESFAWFLGEYLYRKELEPAYGSVVHQIEEAKINSLSIFDVSATEERAWAKLNSPREKVFFYVLPDSDESIALRTVVTFFEKEAKSFEKTSYGVFFSKDVLEPIVYAVERSSNVKLDKEEEDVLISS